MIRRKKIEHEVLKYDPYKLFRRLQSIFLLHNMSFICFSINSNKSALVIFELPSGYPVLELNEQVEVMMIKIYEEEFQFNNDSSEDSPEKRKALYNACENMIKWTISNNKIPVDRLMSISSFIEHSMEM